MTSDKLKEIEDAIKNMPEQVQQGIFATENYDLILVALEHMKESLEGEKLDENGYYLRNKNQRFLGNSPVWYGKDGKGYTAYILGAHIFTKEQAEEMVSDDSHKWEMYKCSDVNKRLHLVFDEQDKGRLGTDKPCGWDSGYANTRPMSKALKDWMER